MSSYTNEHLSRVFFGNAGVKCTLWMHGFILVWVALGADQGCVDSGLVEIFIVVQHPQRISWKMFGRILDEERQKSVSVELLGTTNFLVSSSRINVVLQAS